jgi:osmotically-inducible protein OsmY
MPEQSAPDVAGNEPATPEPGVTEPTEPAEMASADRDAQLTAMIRQKISDDEQLAANADQVEVKAEAGVVTLSGPVETEAEKQKIVELARETEGVERVDDQLEVAAR